jgi:acetyl esterase/lipase
VVGPEVDKTAAQDDKIAGRPLIRLTNVGGPTITVFPPAAANTRAAVLVFPGGGYQVLAMDLEGTEVCDWLASRGITGVLVKYRVPSAPYPRSPMPLQDAQRALRLVRFHAAEWRIDPHKIGVLGFSAGGHLSVAMSTHFMDRLYRTVDTIDRVSCRPDFAVVLYPGHLWTGGWTLNPDIRVSHSTPPTFIAQAEDDPVDDVRNSLVYYDALRQAKVPVEMHLYAQGGHAWGLRKTQFPVTGWPGLVETWLRTIRVL